MRDPNLTPEFEAAFMGCGGGTPVTQCGCGRTCFAADSPHYDEGELDHLQEQRSLKPRRYEEFAGAESVHFVEILGRAYVWGCPCNYAETAQRLLWRYRDEILQYLGARAKREAAEAQQTIDLTEQANVEKGRKL